MDWSDRQVDLLIRLWVEGRSAAAIAARLAPLGRDDVLEKIQLLQLGRPALRRLARPAHPMAPPTHVSVLSHSERLRFARADRARWRAERRADAASAATAALKDRRRANDRQAGLLAALLALDEPGMPDFAIRPRSSKRRGIG